MDGMNIMDSTDGMDGADDIGLGGARYGMDGMFGRGWYGVIYCHLCC